MSEEPVAEVTAETLETSLMKERNDEIKESLQEPEIKELADLADKQILKPDPNDTADIWWWKDGMEGEGPRPDFLQKKFRNILEQAKAYPQLESIAKGHSGAPERYEFDPKAPERFKFDEEDPQFQNFLEVAKKNHLNQNVVREILSIYEDHVLTNKIDLDTEIKKLGDNYAQRLANMLQWGSNNLAESAYQTFEKVINTFGVDGYELFAQLKRNATPEFDAPLNTTGDSAEMAETIDSLRAEMAQNYEKYKTDPRYRTELLSRMERLAN